MIVAIHQPNYIPWIGYFYKMVKADTFVFLDTVQFSKGSFQNRNRIKTPNGVQWLTQPVLHKSASFRNTSGVEFTESNWRDVHLRTLSLNYRRAKAYDDFFPRLQQAYSANHSSKLADFNIALIEQVCAWLGLTTRFVRASALRAEGSSTELLANICQKLGADTYLSGAGGMQYQDEAVFRTLGIDLVYSDFSHPVYPQLWGEFFEGLSIVDLLLNCGEESGRFLACPPAEVAR